MGTFYELCHEIKLFMKDCGVSNSEVDNYNW